jgi:hypothetical protein
MHVTICNLRMLTGNKVVAKRKRDDLIADLKGSRPSWSLCLFCRRQGFFDSIRSYFFLGPEILWIIFVCSTDWGKGFKCSWHVFWYLLGNSVGPQRVQTDSWDALDVNSIDKSFMVLVMSSQYFQHISTQVQFGVGPKADSFAHKVWLVSLWLSILAIVCHCVISNLEIKTQWRSRMNMLFASHLVNGGPTIRFWDEVGLQRRWPTVAPALLF